MVVFLVIVIIGLVAVIVVAGTKMENSGQQPQTQNTAVPPGYFRAELPPLPKPTEYILVGSAQAQPTIARTAPEPSSAPRAATPLNGEVKITVNNETKEMIFVTFRSPKQVWPSANQAWPTYPGQSYTVPLRGDPGEPVYLSAWTARQGLQMGLIPGRPNADVAPVTTCGGNNAVVVIRVR